MSMFDWNLNGKDDEMDKFMDYYFHKEAKETNGVIKVNKKIIMN